MNAPNAKYNNPKWIGQKFGRLTVLEAVEHQYKGGTKNWFWKAVCDCGKEGIYNPRKVIIGHTSSCGCIRKEQCYDLTQKYRIKHNGSTGNGERLFRIWEGMKQRCFNPSNKDYKNYGSRGIRVCLEWQEDYALFREWALSHGYADNLTIDRIDNDGNYEPNNCRWVNYKTQARNRRNVRLVVINNEKKTLAEWSEIFNINPHTVYTRIYKGWDIEKALKAPVKK